MSKNPVSPQNPLLVSDLFHCVLDCIVTSPSERLNKEQRQTLATLARTCRAFSEPSLNVLWRRLNSLLPLIRCFSNAADESRVKTPPSASEWLVINQYTPRVQELTLGNEELSLQFLQFTGLVLPNLTVFRWECQGFVSLDTAHARISFPFDLAFVWPMLTAKITTLEVILETAWDPKYQSFLENYPHLCPNLKSVKFKFRHFPVPRDWCGTPSQELSRAICNNLDWKHVELLPCIGDDVLKHLGMSPTLKSVSLNLASRILSGPDKGYFGPHETPFRNVTDLALNLQDSLRLDVVTRLLRSHDQQFRSFAVAFYTRTIPLEVAALLTALASPQRTHSLQSVRINDLDRKVPPHQHISFETFQPLISLVNLRKLIIHLNQPTSLSDAEFADLARSWPGLQVLKMTWLHGHPEHPTVSVTLKGFLSLLALCEDVREIALTLDARDIPAGEYAHANLCNPNITSVITFCNTPIAHPEEVAKFLLKHIPFLSDVCWPITWYGLPIANPEMERVYRQLWARVGGFIRGNDTVLYPLPRQPSEEDFY